MESKLYGYARCSTLEQNTDMQIAALKNRGCAEIAEEHISGAADHKPALETLLLKLKSGDTLIVWKLDRLGRSLESLGRIVRELNERSINFISLTESIDTSTIQGKLFFNIMASVAEFERELIRERVLTGVRNAMANGTKTGVGFGRPRISEATFIETQKLVTNDKYSLKRACETTGISPMSFSTWRRKNGFSHTTL